MTTAAAKSGSQPGRSEPSRSEPSRSQPARSRSRQAAFGPLRFTVDDYYKMGQAGILDPECKYELIDGVIYMMAPLGPRHADYVDELAELLRDQLGKQARLRVQNPIRLADDTEPQPDLVIAHRKRYAQRHPVADEIHCLIEVCDRSTRTDRQGKLPKYAQAGIREVWLVDVVRNQINVFRDPDPEQGEFQTRSHADTGQHASPLDFQDVRIGIDDLVAPRDEASESAGDELANSGPKQDPPKQDPPKQDPPKQDEGPNTP